MDNDRRNDHLKAQQRAKDLLENEVPQRVRRSIVHVYRVLDNKAKVPQLPSDVQENFVDLYNVVCWAQKMNKRRLKQLVKCWKVEFENEL